MTGVHADGKAFQIQMTPSIAAGRRMIGVTPALGLEVIKTRDSIDSVTDPDSPASEAKPGFEPGDQIVGLDHQITQPFGDGNHDGGGALALLLRLLHQLFIGIDARLGLGLACLGRLFDPLAFARDGALLGGFLARFHRFMGGFSGPG